MRNKAEIQKFSAPSNCWSRG